MTKTSKVLVIYECWRDKFSLTFSEKSSIKQMRKSGSLHKNARKLYTIVASSWEDAMTQHHLNQGWEPYVPFER